MLKDPEYEYVGQAKSVIKSTIKQYSEINFEDEELDLMDIDQIQLIPLTINPQLFLDVILLEMRAMTIKYSSNKKKQRQTNELLLLHELEQQEAALHADPDNDEISNKVKDLNRQLDDINKTEAERAAVRCRAKFQVDGERPTKFFCNLEKSNAAQKFIPSLFVI